MSSIGDADIRRKNILKSVRKSAFTEFESESFEKIDDYPEYRIKFLERRKQFEQPPPSMNKEPFLPNWIKPEDQTDLSITYKNKGDHITDVRIHWVNYVSVDGERRDLRKELEETIKNVSKISADENSTDNVVRHDVEVTRLNSRKQVLTSQKFSPKIEKSFDSLDKNFEQIFDEKLTRAKFTKATLRSAELFKTDEEGNASLSIKITANSNSNRTAANNVNISSIESNNFKQAVRPIISKPILLKKYDHIVLGAINNGNGNRKKKQFNKFLST